MNENCPDLTQLDDRELLTRFNRKRDEHAFEVLIARHGPLIQRVCRRMLESEHDAEDAFQATFLVLAQKARQVRWHNCIANWLYGVALRICRRDRRRIMRSRTNTNEVDQLACLPFEQVQCELLEEALYQAIDRLPDRYRAPLILCDLEGRTRRQAATDLGISEQAIKGRLERGREMLRKRLARYAPAVSTLLVSGALSQQIAHASISTSSAASLAQDVIQLGTGLPTILSQSAIELAQGETAMMMSVSVLKAGFIATCMLAVVATGTLLFSQSGTVEQTSSTTAQAVVAEWDKLDDQQLDLMTRRHLRAIILACHAYIDEHNGVLPPAAVPNANLPPERRLSGLVLLLPYLGKRPAYIAEDDPEWKAWHADNQRAQQVFAQIDLNKAWDDPANAAAAKTVIPEFLAPGAAAAVDDRGMAVSHFAFVRGSHGRDNGMFPLDGQMELPITAIKDGTSSTAAIGQISSDLGPWIAAGPSTARFLGQPRAQPKSLSFGSQHANATYLGNGDGYVYLCDLGASDPQMLDWLAGRDDRTLIDLRRLARYASAIEWKKSQEKKGNAK